MTVREYSRFPVVGEKANLLVFDLNNPMHRFLRESMHEPDLRFLEMSEIELSRIKLVQMSGVSRNEEVLNDLKASGYILPDMRLVNLLCRPELQSFIPQDWWMTAEGKPLFLHFFGGRFKDDSGVQIPIMSWSQHEGGMDWKEFPYRPEAVCGNHNVSVVIDS